MKHTVLARKWRPKKFADLVGQQNSVKVLINIISSERLHHAYLLTGTRGVGKTTIARIIAKALNCLNKTASEPCGECDNCIQIDQGSFVDVIEIDAASNTGIDNIRELTDNARYAPTSGKYKIYIIDEVHMLSKSAFNAMLKTLEEPPTHVIFILATTDLQKVPITILSRCLQLKLRNLMVPEISKHLAYILAIEQEAFEHEAIELIAKAANGSMRDALSILDQAIAFSDKLITTTTVKNMLGLTDQDVIIGLLDALSKCDSNSLTKQIEIIYNNGYDLENILQSLQKILCDLSLAQLASYPVSQELKQFISIISINDVQLYFEIANLGLEQLGKTNDKYPVFVMTILRMLAFHIGTSQEQNSVIHASNFKTTEAVITEKTTPLPKHKPNETTPSLDIANIDTDEFPTPAIIFDGNWIKLVAQLKDKFGVELFPFIENSQLKSHTETMFNITIDERYNSAFSNQLIQQLELTLSEYFTRPIKVKISFIDNIQDTLKEKTTQDQVNKEQNAQNAIHTDSYVLKLCEQFEGKIAPNSIKPIV